MIRSLTFVLSLSSSVFAGTNVWFVDDDGKADFNTIQAAIDAAESGDYIAVMEGVYVESIDFLGKDITVEGESAEKVIIDGSKNASSVMELLDKLHQGGATICMVTHDPRSLERPY